MTTKEHRNILGILFLVQAGLQIFGGILTALIYGGMGAFMLTSSRRGEEQTIGGVFIVLAFVVGFFILIVAAIDFTAGWKLFKQKPRARTWAIVASIISLLGFPLGTALGVYGLWFLFGDAGRNIDSENSGEPRHNAPPPNSWQ